MKMALNLNRSPAYTEHNVPVNEDNFYRGVAVGDSGWESLFNADGVMIGGGKGGTSRLSFQRGYPNDLYVNGLVKADTILEADDTLSPENTEEATGYTYKSEIRREDVENGELHLRVWQRDMGKNALKLTHSWELVFDSFPKEETEINS